MKTMKIWRKSRLSECHANLFANGRVRAIYVNIFVMCAAMLSLASCSSDDDDKDIVEQVTIFVSAETGTYNVVPGTTLEEGMLIRIDHEYYICVAFNTIEGFTYERGHEYELLVKRTTLANPPQDSGKYRYELVRIVSDKKIE